MQQKRYSIILGHSIEDSDIFLVLSITLLLQCGAGDRFPQLLLRFVPCLPVGLTLAACNEDWVSPLPCIWLPPVLRFCILIASLTLHTTHPLFLGFCLELPNKPPFCLTSHVEGTHTFMTPISNTPKVPLLSFFPLILLWSPIGIKVQPAQGSYLGTAIHYDWAINYCSSETATAIERYMNDFKISSLLDWDHPPLRCSWEHLYQHPRYNKLEQWS